jgi:hypothetical protein
MAIRSSLRRYATNMRRGGVAEMFPTVHLYRGSRWHDYNQLLASGKYRQEPVIVSTVLVDKNVLI